MHVRKLVVDDLLNERDNLRHILGHACEHIRGTHLWTQGGVSKTLLVLVRCASKGQREQRDSGTHTKGLGRSIRTQAKPTHVQCAHVLVKLLLILLRHGCEDAVIADSRSMSRIEQHRQRVLHGTGKTLTMTISAGAQLAVPRPHFQRSRVWVCRVGVGINGLVHHDLDPVSASRKGAGELESAHGLPACSCA